MIRKTLHKFTPPPLPPFITPLLLLLLLLPTTRGNFFFFSTSSSSSGRNQQLNKIKTKQKQTANETESFFSAVNGNFFSLLCLFVCFFNYLNENNKLCGWLFYFCCRCCCCCAAASRMSYLRLSSLVGQVFSFNILSSSCVTHLSTHFQPY